MAGAVNPKVEVVCAAVSCVHHDDDTGRCLCRSIYITDIQGQGAQCMAFSVLSPEELNSPLGCGYQLGSTSPCCI